MTFDEWYQQLPQVVRAKMCRTSAEFAWVAARLQGLREAEEVLRSESKRHADASKKCDNEFDPDGSYTAEVLSIGYSNLADAIAGRAGC